MSKPIKIVPVRKYNFFWSPLDLKKKKRGWGGGVDLVAILGIAPFPTVTCRQVSKQAYKAQA